MRQILRRLAPLVAIGALLAPGATQARAATTGDLGVLVMAHGGSPGWNQGVLDAVEPLRDRYPVEVAFGMADACSLQEAVRALEERGVQRIAVVRLFVSGESWLERTEQILGLRPGAPEGPAPGALPAECGAGAAALGQQGQGGDSGHGSHAGHGTGSAHGGQGGHGDHHGQPGHGRSIGNGGRRGHHRMAFFILDTRASFALSQEGLLDAPEMGSILAERARGLSRDPQREDVLVLAHGPADDAENERWLAKLDARAEAIREALPFHRVQVETLREDWPEKRAAAEERVRSFVAEAAAGGRRAIVIPYRLFGFGPFAEVLAGHEYAADQRGLLPHVEVTRWITRQVEELGVAAFRSPAGEPAPTIELGAGAGG